MTNKEMLAEFKISYEYLADIYENEFEQLESDERKEIDNILEKIDDIYFKLWNRVFASETADEDLIIEENDEETIMIGQCASADYSVQNKKTGEFDENTILTCGDLGRYWYYEAIGQKHGDYDYNVVSNGLMKALDEISILSEKCGKEFDYVDKTCELLETSESNALQFLDEFGSDNDEE